MVKYCVQIVTKGNREKKKTSAQNSMIKHEAKYQVTFNKWLREVWKKTGAFELKQTQGKSIAFSSVKPHQIRALLIAKHGVLSYKISDGDIGYKPFDCFCLSGVPAFVVCFFSKKFYLIDIDTWIHEAKTSKRKSLTEERADVLQT